jgi:hypothetical protein
MAGWAHANSSPSRRSGKADGSPAASPAGPFGDATPAGEPVSAAA